MLQRQHLPSDRGGHVRVAVAVTADPGAEGQRPGLGRQPATMPLQLGGQVDGQLGQRLVDQLLQVVHRVACLIQRRRTMPAQLVGLPDQVDHLGQLAVLSLPGGAAGLGRSGQHVGQPTQLGQDGAAAGLGRMRGEHRPDREVAHRLGQPVRTCLGGDRGHRRGQPAVGRRTLAQAAHPVHLLGDVGEVEVGGEGAHQRRGEIGRQLGEQRAHLVPGGVAVLDPLEPPCSAWSVREPARPGRAIAGRAGEPGTRPAGRRPGARRGAGSCRRHRRRGRRSLRRRMCALSLLDFPPSTSWDERRSGMASITPGDR